MNIPNMKATKCIRCKNLGDFRYLGRIKTGHFFKCNRCDCPQVVDDK